MAWTKFKRIEDSANIDSIDVEDGAFIVTKDGKSYADFDNERVPIAGTPDDEMDDTSRNTVENKVIKGYVDNNFTLKGEILWTNPNPTSAISSATNISLSSDDYDTLEVIWRLSTENNFIMTDKFLKGYSTRLYYGTSYRNITRNNNTSYTIQTSSDGSHQNGIPLYIIGYNTGLFE